MTAEREAMTLERQAFVQWLETLQPPIPTTTEVERAWQGYQAAWQYVREKADFAARMTERIAAGLPRAAEPLHQQQIAYGRWIDLDAEGYERVAARYPDRVRTLFTQPPESARDARVTDARVREACAAFSRSFNDKTFPECMRLALDAAMAQESGDE